LLGSFEGSSATVRGERAALVVIQWVTAFNVVHASLDGANFGAEVVQVGLDAANAIGKLDHHVK